MLYPSPGCWNWNCAISKDKLAERHFTALEDAIRSDKIKMHCANCGDKNGHCCNRLPTVYAMALMATSVATGWIYSATWKHLYGYKIFLMVQNIYLQYNIVGESNIIKIFLTLSS